MTLFIVSLIAGVLTVLAPCVLPLLPVILGGVVTESDNKRRPLIIISSLSLSVLVFTLLLKGSTALITVSPSFWSYISASILFLFGLTLLFPDTWARLVLKIPGHNKPDRWIAKGYGGNSSFWTDVLVGAALGPVFTTCSPTFFVILATVLPQSFAMGVIDLVAYIVGLAVSLLLISFIGQRLVNRLGWAVDPKGWFKRTLAILFILLAVAIVFGWDKQLESSILRDGFFDVTIVEQSFHQYLDTTLGSTRSSGQNATIPQLATDTSVRYTDIVDPSGFINSKPFTLADLVGKKVILVDFIDYSCVNCERTFPYLNDWYKKYKNDGLEIVAIHTPEFSFEKNIDNVQAAAQQFGLKFPIVLDNNYRTWNAYGNQYWPHKYLIDIHGNVIYDHIGEGAYVETESEIVRALNERRTYLGEAGTITMGTSTVPTYTIQTQSPETYFGAMRNSRLGNGLPYWVHTGTFALPDTLSMNEYYLGGTWSVAQEYIQNITASAQISFIFTASHVHLVAAPAMTNVPVVAKILIDGKQIPVSVSGSDVKNGMIDINSPRLYNLYSNTKEETHRIDIIFKNPGAQAFTFTFG